MFMTLNRQRKFKSKIFLCKLKSGMYLLLKQSGMIYENMPIIEKCCASFENPYTVIFVISNWFISLKMSFAKWKKTILSQKLTTSVSGPVLQLATRLSMYLHPHLQWLATKITGSCPLAVSILVVKRHIASQQAQTGKMQNPQR